MQGVPEGYIERNVTVASVLLVIAMGIVGLALYLLPLLVGRRRRRAGTIAWVNVLLGWTVIGWVVAMVWAMGTNDDRTEQ